MWWSSTISREDSEHGVWLLPASGRGEKVIAAQPTAVGVGGRFSMGSSSEQGRGRGVVRACSERSAPGDAHATIRAVVDTSILIRLVTLAESMSMFTDDQ